MTPRNIEEQRTLIRTWLIQSGMTRQQLAQQLDVSLASINNWLSCTNIPEKRWNAIMKLFEQKEEPVRDRIVGTSLTKEEMERLEEAAKKIGLSVNDFFRECILRQVKQDLGE